jgi:hypothetical protein
MGIKFLDSSVPTQELQSYECTIEKISSKPLGFYTLGAQGDEEE